MTGQIHVYTGDGKGKTTAALGVALRSAGRKRRVEIIQFLKSNDSGESILLKDGLPGIHISSFNSSGKFIWELDPNGVIKLKEETIKGLDMVSRIVKNNDCDLLILDELNCVLDLKLAEREVVQSIFADKPKNMDVVITGRNAPDWIIDMADLVTEMKNIKHPYDEGIPGRNGLEK